MIPIPFLPNALRILAISSVGKEIVLAVESARESVAYPKCGYLTSSIHSSYRRKAMDLPWRGWTVRLVIRARRFRCHNRDCPRVIFTERFPDILQPYARRTERATEALINLAITAGGEAGSRLAKQLELPISPDTFLRLLRSRRYPRCPRKLSPFIEYLQLRWEEGCRNVAQLHREIVAQGILAQLTHCGWFWPLGVSSKNYVHRRQPKVYAGHCCAKKIS